MNPQSSVTTLPGAAFLGKSVIVKGEIYSLEDLTIEGTVEGTIEMMEHHLTIAPSGSVRANVTARKIEILGKIQGRIEAVDMLCIRKSAEVVGDIQSPRIVIEDGGYVKGTIESSRPSIRNQQSSILASIKLPNQIEALADAVLAS
jgi:cytoskeletal protein CcmA (bactofilin family)